MNTKENGMNYILDSLKKRIAEFDGGQMTDGSYRLRSFLESYTVCEYMRFHNADHDMAIKACAPVLNKITQEAFAGMAEADLFTMVQKNIEPLFESEPAFG